MSRVGLLLGRLHAAEVDLGDEWRKVAQRHATEHDVWHTGYQLAEQCVARAATIREIAARYGHDIGEPHELPWDTVLAAVRRASAELVGRRTEPGLMLLMDLRSVYTAAHEVDLYWTMLGQVAQALRDRELLGTVDGLHRQLLTEIKWIKTKTKEATPQILAVGPPLSRAASS